MTLAVVQQTKIHPPFSELAHFVSTLYSRVLPCNSITSSGMGLSLKVLIKFRSVILVVPKQLPKYTLNVVIRPMFCGIRLQTVKSQTFHSHWLILSLKARPKVLIHYLKSQYWPTQVQISTKEAATMQSTTSGLISNSMIWLSIPF